MLWFRDHNAPQKHVWRAQIVVLSAESVGTNAIVRETGKSKTCLALAGTVRRRRRGRALAQQDAALAHPEARSLGRRAGRGSDHGGAAARNDPLNQRSDGRAGRRALAQNRTFSAAFGIA
jgi:hypothetical protein